MNQPHNGVEERNDLCRVIRFLSKNVPPPSLTPVDCTQSNKTAMLMSDWVEFSQLNFICAT